MQKSRSLRSILVRNYAIISIVPILLFGGVGIGTTVSYIRQELNEKRLILARALSYEIDQYITNGIHVLEHLSAASTPADDPADIQHHLNVTIRYFNFFSSVEIISRSGIVQHVSPHKEELIGNDVSRQSYYSAGGGVGGYKVSDPFISPYTKKPTLALTVFGNKFLYVGLLDLEKLRNISAKFNIGETGYAAVVDGKGYIIAHPESALVEERVNIGNLPIFHKAAAGHEGTFPYRFRGKERFGTVVRHHETGWYLLITQDQAEANRAVRNIVYIFAVILGITVAVSIFLALDNRRKFIRPIRSLMQSAQQISEGGYSVPLGESEYTEINSFINAFKRMLDTIRKRQEALFASTEQYRNLIEHAGSIIMRWNTDLRYTFLNSYALELFGYSESELIGKELIGTTHREKDNEGGDMKTMLQDIIARPDEYRTNENEVINRNGKRRWVQWSNKPIYGKEGAVIEILSIGTDRTAFKEAEQLISNSLREKEILLREIHHRVKNNMQIISSLLSLQSIKIFDSRDLKLFQASQNRVHSMSLIHEQLYESENLAEINFQAYIEELVTYISDMYLSEEDDIQFEIQAGTAYLGVDRAIPCALIVNELLSNAVKYAFPSRPARGRVEIFMEHKEHYTLTIRDNGIGLPPGFDPVKPSGLGYQLIIALTDQLQGELRVESGSGSVITITFS
jgi:PAS domain S-box-containing protein